MRIDEVEQLITAFCYEHDLSTEKDYKKSHTASFGYSHLKPRLVATNYAALRGQLLELMVTMEESILPSVLPVENKRTLHQALAADGDNYLSHHVVAMRDNALIAQLTAAYLVDRVRFSHLHKQVCAYVERDADDPLSRALAVMPAWLSAHVAQRE